MHARGLNYRAIVASNGLDDCLGRQSLRCPIENRFNPFCAMRRRYETGLYA